MLSSSEDVIPPPLEDDVLGSFLPFVFVFCVFKLLFRDVTDSTKNQNRPQNKKKKEKKTTLSKIFTEGDKLI